MTYPIHVEYNLSWGADICNKILKHFNLRQECIPVGCVPPAAVAVGGGLHQAPTPPGTRPPHPQDQTPPPGPDTPQTRPPPVDRHTPVNILPCPKLRLRAVKMQIGLLHLYLIISFFFRWKTKAFYE